MQEELQRHRFVIQDKESIIKRLEFLLNRDKQEGAQDVSGNIEKTFNKSKLNPRNRSSSPLRRSDLKAGDQLLPQQ